MTNYRFSVELKREDKDLPSWYISEDGAFEIDTDSFNKMWLTTTKGKYYLKRSSGSHKDHYIQYFSGNCNGVDVSLAKRPDDGAALLTWSAPTNIGSITNCETCKAKHLICSYNRGRCNILS